MYLWVLILEKWYWLFHLSAFSKQWRHITDYKIEIATIQNTWTLLYHLLYRGNLVIVVNTASLCAYVDAGVYNVHYDL